MPMKKRMKPMYRQGGGIIGLAGSAGSSLDQATQALMEATKAISGGGMPPGRPSFPSPGIGRPTFPNPVQPSPGIPGLIGKLPDFISKNPFPGSGGGIYNESQAFNRGGPVYRVEGGLSNGPIPITDPVVAPLPESIGDPGAGKVPISQTDAGPSPVDYQMASAGAQSEATAPTGEPTLPHLVGVEAHENLNESITGTPGNVEDFIAHAESTIGATLNDDGTYTDSVGNTFANINELYDYMTSPERNEGNIWTGGELVVGKEASGPVITPDMTPEEITEAYITWASDPNNIPDYYGGATIAEFDPAEIEAFRQKELLAAEQDRLNKERLGIYESYLDPESEAQQRAQEIAAGRASTSAYGAGTLGSARSQYASAKAAMDSQRALEQAGLSGIAGVQDDLTKGADLLGSVGEERRKYVQDVINEDIKRWNFAQLAPQQQWDKLLGLANQLKGMELGTLTDSGGNSVPAWKNILADVFAGSGGDSSILESVLGLFNRGGPVISYRQGGGIMGDPMMDSPMPPAPPAPGGIMGAAPAAGAGIMGKPMMKEPMQGGEMSQMGITMMSEEPMSELDKAEGILQGLAAASGGTLKIKRKSKGGK